MDRLRQGERRRLPLAPTTGAARRYHGLRGALKRGDGRPDAVKVGLLVEVRARTDTVATANAVAGAAKRQCGSYCEVAPQEIYPELGAAADGSACVAGRSRRIESTHDAGGTAVGVRLPFFPQFR